MQVLPFHMLITAFQFASLRFSLSSSASFGLKTYVVYLKKEFSYVYLRAGIFHFYSGFISNYLILMGHSPIV